MSRDIDVIAKEAKRLIEYIVKAIVDNTDDVRVDLTILKFRILLELHTNTTDVVHVVGKQGAVVESIRHILYVFGGKNKIKVNLDYITEHENAVRNRH